MIKINEIFHSLQGEGIGTGLPTIFIRFTGCNLRCRYCDTSYAFFEGKYMEIEEIIEKIGGWNCRRVCITGGEPLLQEEVYPLIDSLLEKGYEISVETNGSMDIKKLVKKDITIKMDYKLPSSGMEGRMRKENISLLRRRDELKFIVADRNDYVRALEVLENYSPRCHVTMQPVWEEMDARTLAEWLLEDGVDAMLSLQIHKIIWGEERER